MREEWAEDARKRSERVLTADKRRGLCQRLSLCAHDGARSFRIITSNKTPGIYRTP